jgi:hypothetical protein
MDTDDLIDLGRTMLAAQVAVAKRSGPLLDRPVRSLDEALAHVTRTLCQDGLHPHRRRVLEQMHHDLTLEQRERDGKTVLANAERRFIERVAELPLYCTKDSDGTIPRPELGTHASLLDDLVREARLLVAARG